MLRYFGLIKVKKKQSPVVYNDIKYNEPEYKCKSEKVVREHIEYLKSITEFENNRQHTIESKTTQLVGQTSVIFSLIGLFIPLFIDKFLNFELWEKIVLLFFFFIPLLLYVRAIYVATKSYDIHDYPYSTGDNDCIVNYDTEIGMLQNVVKDLSYSNKVNHVSNNRKGDNLIYANRAFKWGNFTTGIFCFLVLSLGILNSDGKEKNFISVELKTTDSTLNEMNQSLIELKNSFKEIKIENAITIKGDSINSK